MLKLLDADPGSGIFFDPGSGTQERKNFDPGSGINIPGYPSLLVVHKTSTNE
jgi:hypothetical protein